MADEVGDLSLNVKWGGKEYEVTGLRRDETVADLKAKIRDLTGVFPERQKLLGLKYKGKPPDNDVHLSDLNLKPSFKILMMGTKEEELAQVREPPEDISETVNDFDIDVEEIAIENREEHLAKIARRVKEYKVDMLNPPRDGKKLLVLDVDYTFFDHRSVAESASELMRPFLHEFLTSSYEDYDIVIWSATNMKWIKVKMKELGVTNNDNYKVCFMLDNLAMISIHTPKYGVIEVKPLGVIWGKFDQWSARNTIMFDDVRRNFLMNPQTGLRVRPFREAHQNRQHDRELIKLAKYLKAIASVEDFTALKHSHWEKYKPKRKWSEMDSGEQSKKPPNNGSTGS